MHNSVISSSQKSKYSHSCIIFIYGQEYFSRTTNSISQYLASIFCSVLVVVVVVEQVVEEEAGKEVLWELDEGEQGG